MGITADDSITTNFYWHLRHVGTHESRDITFHTIYDPLIWQHPRGRLVFIELPDGDYEFFDWGGVAGVQAASDIYFRIPFSIHAGRVSYLGHVDLTKVPDSPSYKISSTNQFADDRPLLASKIANLSDEYVDQDIAILQSCGAADCRKPKPVMGGGHGMTIVIFIRAR